MDGRSIGSEHHEGGPLPLGPLKNERKKSHCHYLSTNDREKVNLYDHYLKYTALLFQAQ